MDKSLSRQGFTIIEILVVLAIIGILSAVLYGSFSEARQDSKNKALRSELKEVQLALEVYKAQFGQYPNIPACGSTSGGISTAQSITSGCSATGYIAGLVPDFIASLPSHKSAANTNCNIVYTVDATNFSWYKLTARNCIAGATSAANGVSQDDEFARCPSTCAASGVCVPSEQNFYETLAVYSKGGECQ